jgi:hypothetical protein
MLARRRPLGLTLGGMRTITGVTVAVLLASSACVLGDDDRDCTLSAKAGLVIYVSDGVSGAPMAADVVVSDGDYVEEYGPDDAFGGDLPRYYAAEERAGEYAITASSPGYLPASAAAVVELTADGCHVETVTVNVELQVDDGE